MTKTQLPFSSPWGDLGSSTALSDPNQRSWTRPEVRRMAATPIANFERSGA